MQTEEIKLEECPDKHPVLLICEAIPSEYAYIDVEMLDKFQLIMVGNKLYEPKSKDEVIKFIINILSDLKLVEIFFTVSKTVMIRRSPLTKEILEYYGNKN